MPAKLLENCLGRPSVVMYRFRIGFFWDAQTLTQLTGKPKCVLGAPEGMALDGGEGT